MKIETKLNLGEVGYVIKLVVDSTTIDCYVCKGKGTIEFLEEGFECPKCKGTKHINYDRRGTYKPDFCGIIETISVTYSRYNPKVVQYILEPDPCRYIPEDRIFGTIDEAIVACRKLNEKKDEERILGKTSKPVCDMPVQKKE